MKTEDNMDNGKGYTSGIVEIEGKRFIIQDIRERHANLFGARLIPVPLADKVNFAFIGEDGRTDVFLTLVRSFADLHQEYPDTCLYIFGENLLSGEMERVIGKMQLEGSAFFMGEIDEPSVVTERCQCLLTPAQCQDDGFLGFLRAFMRGDPLART